MRDRAFLRSLVDDESGGLQVQPETLVYFYREYMDRGSHEVMDRLAIHLIEASRPILAAVSGLLPLQWRIDAANDALTEMIKGVGSLLPANEFWEVNFRGTLKRRMHDILKGYSDGGRDGVTGTHGDDGAAERRVDEVRTACGPDREAMANIILDLVPPPYRDAFKMVRVDACTLEEAAKRLNVTPRTITNYINKAVSIIRRHLG